MKALPLVLLVALSTPALAAGASGPQTGSPPEGSRYPDPYDQLSGTHIESHSSQQGRTKTPNGAENPVPNYRIVPVALPDALDQPHVYSAANAR
jgi:hypothetical protein